MVTGHSVCAIVLQINIFFAPCLAAKCRLTPSRSPNSVRCRYGTWSIQACDVSGDESAGPRGIDVSKLRRILSFLQQEIELCYLAGRAVQPPSGAGRARCELRAVPVGAVTSRTDARDDESRSRMKRLKRGRERNERYPNDGARPSRRLREDRGDRTSRPVGYGCCRFRRHPRLDRARERLSPEMIIRIGKVFGVSVETLMRKQNSFTSRRPRRRKR